MDVLLIFPCLCIYAGYTADPASKPNWCITCHCCVSMEGGQKEINDDLVAKVHAKNDFGDSGSRDAQANEANENCSQKSTKNGATDHRPKTIKSTAPRRTSLIHALPIIF